MRGFFMNSTALRYPADEGGADDSSALDADTGDVGGDDGALDSDSGGEQSGEQGEPEKLSVREQIKKAMAETSAQGQQPPQEKQAKPKKAPAKAAAATAGQQASQSQQTAQSAIAAPARLSAEAKAEWDKTPDTVKQAFIKAEQDMQRGVDELKGRYAGIEQAIAPHQDALRQMNATPGQAVDRMFLWFKALAGNPAAAFPELAKSMGHDWSKLIGQPQQQQQGQQQPGATQQGAPEIPPQLKEYVGTLESHVRQLTQQMNEMRNGFGTIQNDIQTQQMQKTQENLSIWSQGKEYFEDVRQDMARLIQADPSLIKNGQVDLDAAYERAIYYNPEVRAKVLEAQRQADLKLQQEAAAAATTAQQSQVAAAKKKAVSLPSAAAPGAGNGARKPQQPQGRRSVRESLQQAIAELRDQ